MRFGGSCLLCICFYFGFVALFVAYCVLLCLCVCVSLLVAVSRLLCAALVVAMIATQHHIHQINRDYYKQKQNQHHKIKLTTLCDDVAVGVAFGVVWYAWSGLSLRQHAQPKPQQPGKLGTSIAK